MLAFELKSNDDYLDYDDFELNGSKAPSSSGGGGLGKGGFNRGGSKKLQKRQDQRGGSGGSRTVYSAKHVRAKENLRNTTSRHS